MKQINRRSFLQSATTASAGILALPSLLTGCHSARSFANRRIQVAHIGCGRMGRGDMGGIIEHPLARVVAVCDLDSIRAAAGQSLAVNHYKKQGERDVTVKVYHDYRELLARPDIDAVVVSTPDHWHAQIAIEAALAGKHLYVQKPVTYNIAESIALRKAVQAKKVILQTGSQQRSENPYAAFRPASEAVRNGRLGQLKTIKIGVGLDSPSGKPPAPMTVPQNLDYERWLGSAPEQPYMEMRGHPQSDTSRPGWITTEDFGLGMITNWGAHHIDIAQWAMGQELGGPKTIEAEADFMTNDVWTVHHHYHLEMLYPGGVQVILDDKFENGLHFEGSEGWIFCKRSAVKVTASDPNVASEKNAPLRSSDPKLLSPLDTRATRWMPSPNHYLNWLECIAANRQPIAPIEQSARSLQACATAWIGMKLKRKLTWDAVAESFVGDDEANALRSRQPRKSEFDYRVAMKKAGLA